MIPYIDVSRLTVLGIKVHVFGALLVLAVVVGHSVLVRRARAVGAGSPWIIEGFAIVTVAAGIGMAYAESVVLGKASAGGAGGPALAMSRLGLSTAGGLAGGIIGGAAYLRVFRLDYWRFADLGAYAFPFAWFFARMGCAAAHDHLGRPSSSLLAVRFPSGPRLDMGLIEWLLSPLLVALVVIVSRRTGRPGAIAGALAVAYSLIRFPLDFLRADDLGPASEPRYAGLTGAQWICLPMLLFGALALVRAWLHGPEAPLPEVTASRRATKE